MPTYGYRCPACGAEFDVWQKMSDAPGADCPSCGSAAKRMFFPAGLVFKGAGFYATDSRKQSSSNGSSTSSKSESSDAASKPPPKTSDSSSGTSAAQSSATPS